LGEGITRLLSNQLLLSRFQQQKNLLVLSELKLVHAQINPHFLFNALNTIIAILRTDAARARELLIDLSNFFRKNLKRKSDFSSLEEELEHVNSYLEIEKARFEDRLVVNMNIDPALLQMRMPAFTLQPLIENAIKHGISQLLAQGVVSIRAYYEDRVAIIEIEDNAGAYDEGKHSKDGLGIKLVNKRIRSLFGTDFGTSVACVRDEITRVTLRLPLEATRALEVTAQ
jgi:two-component system LytT family sensor kinase